MAERVNATTRPVNTWSVIRDAVSRAERLGREPLSYEAASAKLDEIARDAADVLVDGAAEAQREAVRQFFEAAHHLDKCRHRYAEECTCGLFEIRRALAKSTPTGERDNGE